MPSESDILYRGTAAGTTEPALPPEHCRVCGQITSLAELRLCSDCRIDRDWLVGLIPDRKAA